MPSGQAIKASALVCGTMRMLEHDRNIAEWGELFVRFYKRGITTLHSSSEYESFPLFCKVMAYIHDTHPKVKFKHIVKLAAPGFDEQEYIKGTLKVRVAEYCKTLGVSKIEVIQWMWRADLKNDKQRIKAFVNSGDDLYNDLEALKKEGTIGQFLCFPYTPEFAIEAVKTNWIDGLIVYRNILEQEYTEALHECERYHKTAYIIRPLAAKNALGDKWNALSLVKFGMDPVAVNGVIIGLSSEDHLDDILGHQLT